MYLCQSSGVPLLGEENIINEYEIRKQRPDTIQLTNTIFVVSSGGLKYFSFFFNRNVPFGVLVNLCKQPATILGVGVGGTRRSLIINGVWK